VEFHANYYCGFTALLVFSSLPNDICCLLKKGLNVSQETDLIQYIRRSFGMKDHVKYLGVIFDKRIAWRLHVEMIAAKAFRTFIRIYCLFRIECLSASFKLTLHMALTDQ
jgi:hypothetical protein